MSAPLLQSCRGVVYASGEPLVLRAQQTGELRDDVTIDDAVRLVAGIAAVAFPDPAQRDRVIDIALDGLRAQHRD